MTYSVFVFVPLWGINSFDMFYDFESFKSFWHHFVPGVPMAQLVENGIHGLNY